MNFKVWCICLFLFLIILQRSNAQTYNVTFSVDMNGQTGFTIPELNGTFNNWCGNCSPMSDVNNDGIWEVTEALAAGSYEYKFSADSWNFQENLVPGSICTVTNFGFTNRTLLVNGPMTLPIVCWGSCTDCAQTPNFYNVTFQLDMNGQAGFTTPEVNGTFNAWCGSCTQMTDANGDNIWEVTVYLQEGNYEYKFSFDNWTDQEILLPGSNCTVTNGAFTSRTLNVTSATTLPAVCWESCNACDPNMNPHFVTFRVDMSNQQVSPNGVHLAGSFQGWNPSDPNWQLSHVGNGIYEITKSLASGVYEYKFINGNAWGFDETAVTACGANGNRQITVTGSDMTVSYCFNSCDNSCTQSGCTDIAACNYSATAVLDNGSCLYSGNGCNDNNPGTMNDVISDQCQCNGITIIQGCTNELACNFNPMANVENNSCLFTGNACNDQLIATLNDVITEACVCSGTVTDLNGNNENTYQGVFYQAVARNANGSAMANQNVNVRFTLRQGSANGAVEYQETQLLATNAQGLFSTTFGQGQAQSGSYAQIQWGINSKFLQVEFESNGWQTIGTQQLMAVPYAIRAKQVEPSGIKYQSPNGSCFILQVNDAGQISSVSVPCD